MIEVNLNCCIAIFIHTLICLLWQIVVNSLVNFFKEFFSLYNTFSFSNLILFIFDLFSIVILCCHTEFYSVFLMVSISNIYYFLHVISYSIVVAVFDGTFFGKGKNFRIFLKFMTTNIVITLFQQFLTTRIVSVSVSVCNQKLLENSKKYRKKLLNIKIRKKYI